MNVGLGVRKSRILAGFAFAMAISSSSGALAQCVGTITGASQFAVQALTTALSTGGTASGSFAGALGNMETAFQTQQGSAFVSAPNDPQPNQPGGGVWTRAVGGEVTTKFTSSVSGTLASANPAANASGSANCAGSVHETFSGMQVGQDVSRLNWNGWNIHLGTTAGYLASHATDNIGGVTDFQVPFLGTTVTVHRAGQLALCSLTARIIPVTGNPFNISLTFSPRYWARRQRRTSIALVISMVCIRHH